jgi:hypothetical protein
MLDFPANPTVGQQFTAAGVTWVWDGVKWAASGLSVAYVPLAGFVPAMNDNRLINGDMRIDQRWNGGSGTANGYTVDRWSYSGSVASIVTWQRVASSLAGFPYQLIAVTATAHALVAADYFVFQQAIEADMIGDFAWGTANAQPVTLSFWVTSSLTGTFGGSLQNYAVNRSYPFSYSIPVANTWTKITITIPGDTAGTWVMSGNGGSLVVTFSLGMGSTRSGPANAWAAGNFLSVPGAVSVVGTNGAVFDLTGVKLEIGSVATPYNRQSLAKSLADCQRYYNQMVGVSQLQPGGAVSSGFGQTISFLPMRTLPTVTISNASYVNASGVAVASSYYNFTILYAILNANAGAQWTCNIVMNAEL